MSSHLSPAFPRDADSGFGRPTEDDRGRASGDLRRRAALSLGVAALLCAIGFVTGGGVDEIVASWRNTWVEIGVDAVSTVAIGAAVLRRPPGRRHGLVSVVLMAVLFALETASIAWSVAPDSSWLASGQMLAYLAVFAAATALARPLHRDWPALLGGLVIWAAAICLWSLVVKVFPASLASANQYGRLEAPFGYWNAVASVAAMGVPCCLWLGARRDGGHRLAALAAPALALLVAVLVLSYSRSADLAAVVATAAWLLVVPLRLRAVAIAVLGAIAGAVISVWGLTHQGITGNGVAIATQDHAGHIFGIVVLAVLVVVTAAGVATTEAMDRTRLTAQKRQRLGSSLVALLVVLVAIGVGGVAASHRGLTGQISHGWHELTNPAATVSATSASRVFQFGSSRPTYWHEALQVGDRAAFKGVGELGFSVARLLYPGNPEIVLQAHSYVFETFADLGVLGLLVSAALLLSWLWAVTRTVALQRDTKTTTGPERAGMLTLAAVVLAFGVQSTLDWTWFFTGVAVPALLAAGWLAGRGPVTETVEARPAGASVLDRPLVLAGVPLLVAIALLGGWLTWRPLHSADLVNQAEDTGSYAAALGAQRADPIAILPYQVLSSLALSAHDPLRAEAELRRATRQQPRNPASWSALAQFLAQRHLWREALVAADHVKALDVTGDITQIDNDALINQLTADLAAASRASTASAAPAG